MTESLRQLRIGLLTQREAEEIAAWRYEPPYDFYDATADHRDLAELLDSERRGDRYFAARDTTGRLVGYFGFARQSDVLGMGIGLRPDLTGRGVGLVVLEQGLAYARERFRPKRFRLSVAEFNARAITVYERAGFERTRSYVRETNGGAFEFVEMEREA